MSARVLYLSHGGGPLPLLGDRLHTNLIKFLTEIPKRMPVPKAIVLISAHWEERELTITASEKPALIYDYYGFPKEAYQLTYPVQGNPQLAKQISLLHDGCVLSQNRGFDHGVYIPLSLMYPQADIPVVQISLLSSLDAYAHYQMGRSLSSLLKEDILVIGSGFSFHNMQQFWKEDDEKNNAFQNYLIHSCCSNLSYQERMDALVHWEQAPFARYCHPREEHLLPLHVCSGMAKNAAKLVFDEQIIKRRAVGFLWENL